VRSEKLEGLVGRRACSEGVGEGSEKFEVRSENGLWGEGSGKFEVRSEK